jgi:transposase
MKKVQRTYSLEFKREAVRLAQTSGKPIAQVAELSWASPTPPFTSGVRNWLIMEMKPFRAAAIRLRRREDLRRLNRELEVRRQERDILKQAFSVFSRTSGGDLSFFQTTSREYRVKTMCQVLAVS